MYTTKEIAILANISQRNVNYRAKMLHLQPAFTKLNAIYFTEEQKDKILKYRSNKKNDQKIHIIYLVKEIEWLILPSKLNYE